MILKVLQKDSVISKIELYVFILCVANIPIYFLASSNACGLVVEVIHYSTLLQVMSRIQWFGEFLLAAVPKEE